MQRFSNIELALAALIVEAAIGYPEFVYAAVGHPVTWMGALLSALDRRLNRPNDSARKQRLLGAVSLVIVLAAAAAAAALVSWIGRFNLLGAVLLLVTASSLIAQRSLYEHVRAVAAALETNDLEAGRRSVAMIVGRNPDVLDEAGVARAAIESLAENFSDAVVAPIFWLAAAALPGAAIYKAANTADSMIGHRTPRFQAFGWAAARLDDALNFPASRLSALFIVLAGGALGESPSGALRAIWRDAGRHRSPNAGWPEAAMAGALGLKLGGPRVYGDALVGDAFMGDGHREASASDIRRALRVFRVACLAQWLLGLALWLIWRA